MTELGDFSLLMIYGAMAAYTVAMLAFAIDLSSLRARRDADGHVVTAAAASADAVGGVAVLEKTEAAPQMRRRGAGIGMSTLWLGFILHLVGVVTRGIAAGHVPWSNLYEFSITLTLVVVGIYLAFSLRHDVRYLGVFVALPVLLMLGVSVVVLYTQADGLAPILDHYWLVIHVLVAIMAIAVFGIAAVLAVLQLVKDFAREGSVTARVLAGLPSAATLERVSYRFTAVGFVLWTFTLVAGAIWANEAWSRPWGWDAKEVWTFAIWVIYAAYLHARATRGWDGRRAAALVIIGFVAILGNYFVVNFLLSTNHGYAL